MVLGVGDDRSRPRTNGPGLFDDGVRLLPVALVWGEFYAVPALLVTGIVPLGIGRLLVGRFAGAERPNKLRGMMIAASGWFCIALFGSLPFTIVAWTIALNPGLGSPEPTATLTAFENPFNGFFESMSGFTGTGLTMTDNEEVLPATLQ